jgi:hypothetical protein
MTAHAYLRRLGILIFVFFVLIPGIVAGPVYLFNMSGGKDALLGAGYIIYFVGIPVWIIALAISLWRTVRLRVAAVGMPTIVAFSFIPFVFADWMAVMTFFQNTRRPPFLLTALVVVLALIFWPTGQAQDADDPTCKMAQTAAVGAILVQAGLATVSVAGTLAQFFVATLLTYNMQFYPASFGYPWLFVVVVTQVLAIVVLRRNVSAPAS